jgi:ADP-ribosylglycohydrolase
MEILVTPYQRSSIVLKKNQNYFRGCLIGGAIGDTLGWSVEFLKIDEIYQKYGPEGII